VEADTALLESCKKKQHRYEKKLWDYEKKMPPEDLGEGF
jgi:hypothetical protein